MGAPVEVDLDAVDEREDYDGEAWPPVFIRHGGAPFTGVVRERKGELVTRIAYRDGRPHGDASTSGPDGKLQWKAQYRDGLEHGESHAWSADGTLRHYHRYDDHGKAALTQYFDERGTLRHEWTVTRQRTWYADKTLRSDRIDGLRWAFTRDGRRAFGEGVQSLAQAHVYDHFVFEDAVVRDAFDELLGEFEFERGVWLWMHRRLDAGEDANPELRKALAHDELEARATALNMIGARRIVELVDDVRAMASDPRVPPMRHGEYPGQGGRGHTLSIGQMARDALAKLTGES